MFPCIIPGRAPRCLSYLPSAVRSSRDFRCMEVSDVACCECYRGDPWKLLQQPAPNMWRVFAGGLTWRLMVLRTKQRRVSLLASDGLMDCCLLINQVLRVGAPRWCSTLVLHVGAPRWLTVAPVSWVCLGQ
jgi:hypothetical protein